jgi:hypothetical protein
MEHKFVAIVNPDALLYDEGRRPLRWALEDGEK